MRHMLAIIACLFAMVAKGEDYPARTLKLVVPAGPGGGTDILARHMAQKMSERLRQPVVVENRPGAGSILGTDYVAKSPADGYTLLVGGIFNMVMNKALVKNLPYEPLRDFVPLGTISAYPFVLVARADLPAADFKEFVAYARGRPGKLTYGSAGLGTLQHVWGTILLKSLGLELVHVPFKAAPAVHQEMLAGRTDVLMDNLSAVKHHVQAGRLRAYAVSSAERTAQLADVPTLRENGVDFVGESWFAMFAPAGTAAPVISLLRSAVAGVLHDADFAARIDRDGGRVLAIPPAAQGKFLQDEVERWGALVTRYGVGVE
jgi:tripartite-type tricarboxylate transporter receptor subunit TctC